MNLPNKPFKLLTLAECSVIAALTPFFDFSEGYCEYNDDALFLVCEGDAYIESHLHLDTDMLQQFMRNPPAANAGFIEGMLVTGSLSVQGSIINEEGDYGPCLYVGGTVHCQSFLEGGSLVFVNGDITAKEAVLCHYNHGTLRCNGTVKAPVFIIFDHYTYANNHEASLFYYNDKTGDCQSEIDWLCPPQLTDLLDNPVHNFEHLIFDLAAGEFVLKTSPQQEKNEEYWFEKIRKSWQNMERLPEAFKTNELFLKAFDLYGAITFNYFPHQFITAELCAKAVMPNTETKGRNTGVNIQYIPESFITSELCYLAARYVTYIRFIPSHLLNEALVEEIIRYNPGSMEDVPEQYLTEQLLVVYVQTSKGLWLDKYCRKAGVEKDTVLFKALEGGVAYMENVWGWHFSAATYACAQQLYDNDKHQAEWRQYTEQFKKKIERIATKN
ncbi:polymer-forming cytoskeletal protein [Paenibacillus sp. GCM10027626]|uniref:polymer-forming cytoskeletal protein n=1 Tax=Paenibacillus sp. GCM10027626 TaxID=3273411 RepID=UPI0036392726